MTFSVVITTVVNVANDSLVRGVACLAVAVFIHDQLFLSGQGFDVSPVPVRIYFAQDRQVYSFESEIFDVFVRIKRYPSFAYQR